MLNKSPVNDCVHVPGLLRSLSLILVASLSPVSHFPDPSPCHVHPQSLSHSSSISKKNMPTARHHSHQVDQPSLLHMKSRDGQPHCLLIGHSSSAARDPATQGRQNLYGTRQSSGCPPCPEVQAGPLELQDLSLLPLPGENFSQQFPDLCKCVLSLHFL